MNVGTELQLVLDGITLSLKQQVLSSGKQILSLNSQAVSLMVHNLQYVVPGITLEKQPETTVDAMRGSLVANRYGDQWCLYNTEKSALAANCIPGVFYLLILNFNVLRPKSLSD